MASMHEDHSQGTARRRPALPVLAGLCLSVNLYLLPWTATSPRLTDAAGAVLAVWVLYRLARTGLNPAPLALLGLASLAPAVWGFLGVLDGRQETAILAARWLLALPWAVALLQVMNDPRGREGFALGLAAGGMVNVLVILLQAAGMEAVLRQVGLSSSGATYTTYVAHAVRLPGLHGQHNASSAVISLAVPAAAYLYLRRSSPLWVFLLVVGGLLAALHLTSTRSPLLVTAGTLAVAMAAARRFGRALLLAAILAIVLVSLLATVGPPGGWVRWRDEQAMSINAGERLQSTTGAARLAVEHPWGMGAEQGKAALADRTSYAASHNAYLQASLLFGLPFALLVSWSVLHTAVAGGLRGVDHPRCLAGLLALQCGGLFLFEEHLNNPTFIILTAWFLAVAAWRPGVPAAAAAAPPALGLEDLGAMP